jgi:hypothetical protein
VVQWHIQTPAQQQATVVTGVQSIAGVQTEHARFSHNTDPGNRAGPKGIITVRRFRRVYAVEKLVYTHPTLRIRRDATMAAWMAASPVDRTFNVPAAFALP